MAHSVDAEQALGSAAQVPSAQRYGEAEGQTDEHCEALKTQAPSEHLKGELDEQPLEGIVEQVSASVTQAPFWHLKLDAGHPALLAE